MNTFAARIVEDADTRILAEQFRELARGTNFRAERVAAVWGQLDPKRLARRIVDFLAETPDRRSAEGDLDAIIIAALERGRLEELARACTLRASDGFDLIELATTPPRSYGQQTEGMHALAIKEISFASSDLPAVSDQPEDAVPTQKIFEQMVPALRSRRAHRQFIVASHDANVVVAADVERIFVLDPLHPASPRVGTLFDKPIREAALDLLEGGRLAFERRNQHYARQ